MMQLVTIPWLKRGKKLFSRDFDSLKWTNKFSVQQIPTKFKILPTIFQENIPLAQVCSQLKLLRQTTVSSAGKFSWKLRRAPFAEA